jgi:hypothetical protein
MPKTVICPESRLPEGLYSQKRHEKPFNTANTSIPTHHLNIIKHKVYGNSKNYTSQRDLRLLHTEIKEFSASSSSVTGKRKAVEDKLTKLGAPPPKQMKIPFNIKLGMMKKQKLVAQREEERIKESGVVVARKKPQDKKRTKPDSSGSKKKRDSNSIGIDRHHVKDGMLRLKQNPVMRRR